MEQVVVGNLFGALPPPREFLQADALRLDVTAASFLH